MNSAEPLWTVATRLPMGAWVVFHLTQHVREEHELAVAGARDGRTVVAVVADDEARVAHLALVAAAEPVRSVFQLSRKGGLAAMKLNCRRGNPSALRVEPKAILPSSSPLMSRSVLQMA